MKKLKLCSIITAALMTTSITIQGNSINAYAKEEGPLKVQMYNSNTDETTKSAGIEYKIKNTSTSSVDLSKIKLRYYYTTDSSVKENYYCDNAAIVSGYNYTGITDKVKGNFVALDKPMKDADHYLEIGFSSDAGTLAPDDEVTISSRFAKDDWRSFNQKNDYSFKDEFKYSVTTSNETYNDWNKTALFVNDKLVSGEVPCEEIDVSSIKHAAVSIDMFNGITDKDSNTIAPRLRVTNTSDEVVDLSKLKLNYYFTSDGEKRLNFFCDHAAVTSPVYRGITSLVNGTISNYDGGSNKDKADKKLEISFDKEAGILEQGESMEIQTRVSKEDWTNFNQDNDYSFNGTSKDYESINKLTAFINGNLVYGEEPSKYHGGDVEDKDSVISPLKLTYDKQKPSEISTSMTLNGNKLLNIMDGDKKLVKDEEYTVNEDKVVFTKTYLDSLSKGTYNFTFNFDKGNSKNFELTVVDNPVENDFTVEVGKVEGYPGDIVTVPVSVKNINQFGLDSFNMKLYYDTTKFENVSIDPVNIPDADTTFSQTIDEETGLIRPWFDNMAFDDTERISKDGVLFNIKMKIKEDASIGTSVIKNASDGDSFVYSPADDEAESYKAKQVSGAVEILSPVVVNKISSTETSFKEGQANDVTVDYSGNELKSLKNGEAELKKDKDYTVADNKVTLSKDYLNTLKQGDTNITFDFEKGEDLTYKISVEDPGLIDDNKVTELTLEAGKVKGKPGDTVTIPVSIKSLSKYGLDCFDITMHYDPSKFENVSLEPVNIPDSDNTFESRIDEKTGTIRPGYMNIADDEARILKDGVLFNVKMKIKDDAEYGISTIKCSGDACSFGYWPVSTNMDTYKVNSVDGEVEIVSPEIENKISSTETSFKEGQADDVTVEYSGNELKSLKNGEAELKQDKDYTVANNKVTLSKDYLNTLKPGDTNLTFDFKEGEDLTYKITVEGDDIQKITILSTPKITAKKGETFVLPVQFSNVSKDGVTALVIDFKYDKNRLEIVDYKAGDIIADEDSSFYADIDNEKGIVEILTSWEDSETLVKPGTIVNLTFKVKDDAKEGITKLEETGDTVLLQNDGTQQDYSVECGEITIK